MNIYDSLWQKHNDILVRLPHLKAQISKHCNASKNVNHEIQYKQIDKNFNELSVWLQSFDDTVASFKRLESKTQLSFTKAEQDNILCQVNLFEFKQANQSLLNKQQPLTEKIIVLNKSDNNLEKITCKQKVKSKKILKFMIWMALCLLMLLSFIAQYLYFNFDSLARNANQRIWLEMVCQYIDCRVPELDADKIYFTEIRTTENGNKTNLSFVIHNDSTDATLLPSISVKILKNNEEIGSNILSPNQYLIGQYKKLPAFQPISGEVTVDLPKSDFDTVSLSALY